RLAGAALLALVGGSGEAEGAGDELDVDIGVVSSELGQQPLEELLVPLACLQGGHEFSVLPGLPGEPPWKERPLENRSDASQAAFQPLQKAPQAPPPRPRTRSLPARALVERGAVDDTPLRQWRLGIEHRHLERSRRPTVGR